MFLMRENFRSDLDENRYSNKEFMRYGITVNKIFGVT